MKKKSVLVSKLSSTVDFEIEPSMVTDIPNFAPVVQRYFDMSPEGNYTATFKLNNGQITINGQPLR